MLLTTKSTIKKRKYNERLEEIYPEYTIEHLSDIKYDIKKLKDLLKELSKVHEDYHIPSYMLIHNKHYELEVLYNGEIKIRLCTTMVHTTGYFVSTIKQIEKTILVLESI